MALDNVKFLQGTSARYQEIVSANAIEDNAFYYCVDTSAEGAKSYALYLGKTLLSNGTLEADVAELQGDVSELAAKIAGIIGGYEEDEDPISLYELEQALIKMNGPDGYEGRLAGLEIKKIPALEARIGTAEGKITTLEEQVTTLEGQVKFSSNIRLTENFGKYKVDASTGYVEVPTEGMTAEEVILTAFQTASDPTSDQITQPSVSLTCSQGSKEVGTKVTPSYSASLGAGSYPYGPATGITASSWEVSIANTGEDKKTSNSGTFGEIEVIDGMSGYAKVTAKATWNMDGADPKNNLGGTAGNAADVKIKAGNDDAVSSGYSGYRGWFYGYKSDRNITPANITSDQVRGLGSGVKTSIPSSMTTNKMQQMYFAIPKKNDGTSNKSSIAVANSTNGAPQTVQGPITVYVEGANNYKIAEGKRGTLPVDENGLWAYDLFYIDNDNPEAGSTTWKITVG